MTDINYSHYLKQLGFTDFHAIEPDLDTLKRLQLAHQTQYPFQSITTVLDRPADLAEASLYNKIVERRLGGYCYELNGLFLDLLRHLGYEARIITGIVIINNQLKLERRNARTHMAIIVTIEQQNYLVDVGFGGLVPTAPLLFAYHQQTEDQSAQDNKAAQIQSTPHGRYKIIRDDRFADQNQNPILPHSQVSYERYILCCEVKSEWQMLYVFDLLPQIKIDMIVGNWYISTYPDSPFKDKIMVSRTEDEGVKHTLFNNKYHKHQVGKPSQTKIITSVDELLSQLKEVFFMPLKDDITSEERQRLQSFLDNVTQDSA